MMHWNAPDASTTSAILPSQTTEKRDAPWLCASPTPLSTSTAWHSKPAAGPLKGKLSLAMRGLDGATADKLLHYRLFQVNYRRTPFSKAYSSLRAILSASAARLGDIILCHTATRDLSVASPAATSTLSGGSGRELTKWKIQLVMAKLS